MFTYIGIESESKRRKAGQTLHPERTQIIEGKAQGVHRGEEEEAKQKNKQRGTRTANSKTKKAALCPIGIQYKSPMQRIRIQTAQLETSLEEFLVESVLHSGCKMLTSSK